MSLRKRLLYSCIAMLGAVCLAQVGVNAQSFMQASEKIPNYERIFYATENAVLADNVVVDTIGASGVKVTALKNSTTLDFKHNFYGNFDLGFSIVPLQTGEYDFSSLQFTFTETKTGKYFDVCYQIKEVEGVISGEFAVKIPHRTSRYVAKTSDVSFTGEGERFESFEFNPYTMEVYYSYGGNKTKAVSLKDENLFLSFFNTHETYDSFEAYNVSMTFNGLKKESASVVLASLCGQNLGGTQLMNTAGAVIADMPSIQNGVVGKALALPTNDIRTFDILDGEQKGFKGEITVKDPLGNTVFVENNTFIPNVAGEYMISYTPRDAEDMVGKPITQSVTVYSKAPVLSLEYEFALTDGYSISKNNVVLLPAAKGNSALINDDSRYEAFVSVTVAGDKILENVSVDESYILTFPKTGTAEIVYATSDFYGQKYEEKFSLNILESGVDFSALQFDRTQTLGDTVKLPTLLVGDTVVYPIVQYPDGRTVQGAYAKLDVSGAYSLYYNVENSEYYLDFTVEQTQKGLFDYDKNITATDGYSAPDYADANYQGLLLTANANNATAVYNKPIDLSKKTQSDLLLEFFLCPEKMGDYEFECFTVTLTDKYDATNKIDVKFERETSGGNYHYILYASACANTDEYYSAKKTVVASFYGKYQRDEAYGYYPSQSIRVYFDYATGCIYLSALERAASSKTLLVNLKDTASVGDNHEFRGFKTGECTLSVSFSRIAKEKASVLILNVDGNELSEVSNIDKTAPNIIVDFADYNKNELPYGIVGHAYNVFDYVAYDVFGFVEYSDVRVYSKQGQEKTYFSVVNDRFVPTKRGLYYLEYTAIDDWGNESNEIVSITVLNDGEFVAPNYTFGDFEEEYFVGEEIKIPQGEIFEGDFKATQEIKVFFGGKEIDVDANSFLPLAAGKYRIQVALKTYAKTFSFEKEINVNASELPIISLCTLPKAMVVNDSLDLTKITAKEYLNGTENNVTVLIKVDGEVISDKVYKPTSAGVKTLEIIANGSVKTKTAKYTLTVMDPTKTSTFLEGYFYTENCRTESNYLDYTFISNDKGTVTFAKSLYGKSVNFSFAIPNTGANFDGLTIYLTDSVNANIKVGVKFIKDETSPTKGVFVLEGEQRRVNTDLFTDTASFGLYYDDETKTFSTSKGVVLGKVTRTVDGKVFNGFESGKVYLEFAYTNASLKLTSIANQNFGSLIMSDSVGPYIQMKTELGETLFGKSFTIPAVHVFDVLSEVKEIYAEILDDNDNVIVKFTDISKINEYTLSKYGKYRLVYTVTDFANQKTSSVEDFEIKDTVSPTLYVNGTVATYGVSGRKINLPSASAMDNASANIKVRMYLILPNGVIKELKETSFIPDQIGTHTLVYQCSDEEGNSTVKFYKIRIVEGEE